MRVPSGIAADFIPSSVTLEEVDVKY